MTIIGAFLGGSPGALIPAGKAVLNLQWQAEDRKDIKGASFTVAGQGLSKTVPASDDGRAYLLVPVGSYTASVTHTGTYIGAEPVTVQAESQKSYLVFFDGRIDYYAELRAEVNTKLGKDETAVRALADGNGLNIAETYATRDYVDNLPPGYRITLKFPTLDLSSLRIKTPLEAQEYIRYYTGSEVTSKIADTTGENPLTCTQTGYVVDDGESSSERHRVYTTNGRINLTPYYKDILDGATVLGGNFIGSFKATVLFSTYTEGAWGGKKKEDVVADILFTYDGNKLVNNFTSSHVYDAVLYGYDTARGKIGATLTKITKV